MAGIRIRFHWLFALLLLIAAIGGRYVEALILVGSLTLHELAHLIVAWVLGIEVETLVLTPFGGMARMNAALEFDPQAETSIALAGPFQSFFLAGLALLFMGNRFWDQGLMRFFFEINANLAFFNLIPALPLDGGRALRGLLAQRWGYRHVTLWITRMGRLCGFAMSAMALLVFFRTRVFYGAPLAVGFFLGMGTGQEMEAVTYRSYRQFLSKRQRILHRHVATAGHLVVIEGTKLSEVLNHLSGWRYHLVLVVDHNLCPIGTLHEAELMDAFQEMGPAVTVEQILEM